MTTNIHLFDQTAEAIIFYAGETIFFEGDMGDTMYVIREGEVDIVQDGFLVETLGVGQVFGEMALIRNEPRMADAIARTDCVVMPIDARSFLHLIDTNRAFSLNIMRALCERLLLTHVKIAAPMIG